MNPGRFRQLQDLFHAVLQRAPRDRESFVREVSEGDDELRGELLSLLKAHRDDDAFLETAFGEAETPLLDGQSVGPYRIAAEIGRGGMGVVYRAEDTRLNRPVALKALNPRLLADPKQQERFRREAMVAGSLSHPAIATIYALEEVAGRFYIVSEYVPGDPLRVEMDRAPLAPGRVLRVGLQVAGALAAAHAKGVVHRDLKPENIVLVDQEQLKIVDFGLAIGPGTPFANQRLTGAGMIVGTPAYMSPEQVRGEVIDFRSDLFSFGILMYEMLTGEHPFASGSVLGISARILESAPGRPDRLRDSAPGLDRIILRCLEKSPDNRFGSTREVVRDLEALSGAFAIQSAAPGPVEESPAVLRGHWWVVHQSLVIALYTIMIVLLFVAKAGLGHLLLEVCAFLALACGVGNGAVRVHLLFTFRFNRKSIRKEIGRTGTLIRGIDLGFSLVLLAAALGILSDSQPWAAALASVGVSYAVVSFIAEPTTIRSVFSGGDDDPRRDPAPVD